jgi:hypothetical protein
MPLLTADASSQSPTTSFFSTAFASKRRHAQAAKNFANACPSSIANHTRAGARENTLAYIGSRKNEFDLRRASAVSNLEVIQRQLEASAAITMARAA